MVAIRHQRCRNWSFNDELFVPRPNALSPFLPIVMLRHVYVRLDNMQADILPRLLLSHSNTNKSITIIATTTLMVVLRLLRVVILECLKLSFHYEATAMGLGFIMDALAQA